MERMTRNTSWMMTLLMPAVVSAQDLVPATSEDLAQFDRQLLLSTQKGTDKEIRKDKTGQAGLKGSKDDRKNTTFTGKSGKGATENFGASISEEARQLNEASHDDRKEFGDWVSSQRRQDEDKRPDSTGASGGTQGSTAGSASQADVKREAKRRDRTTGAGSTGRGRQK